ncbi:MAG: 16S rRNA (uracil(1498)-N(3))-methyltransferase [Alphaproteobacteria bacterium]|nr:16S rRNA (uracil(1498)-N(3))-methyltransferase [Alphaproteobacteria bacterium]
MKRVLVAELPATAGQELDPVPSHHLEHVMRASTGDGVLLYDGAGNEQPAVIVGLSPVRVDPAGEVRACPPPPPVHLVLSVLKHQPMDLALRMATEAGAAAIHPVIMERTVAKGDRHDRWERIVASAAEQCGRAHLPVLSPIRRLAESLDTLDFPLLFGAPGADRPEPAPGGVAVVIGPAGGLAPREIQALLARGARPIGLGPYVLRAETAVAAALALLTA